MKTLSNEDVAMLTQLTSKELGATTARKIGGMTLADLEQQGYKIGHLRSLLRKLQNENVRRQSAPAWWWRWFA